MSVTTQAACATISVATASHAAALRTLWASLEQYAPDCDRLVVGLGDWPDNSRPPRGWIAAQELLSPADLGRLSERYTTAEICFYLKPVALAYALGKGYESAHYLDTDLWFIDTWNPAQELGEAHLMLTPHLHTESINVADAGSLEASQRLLTLLRAGLYNAGYLAVRNTTIGRGFLRWWQARLETHGDVAPYVGLNGDQRWLDAAPLLFQGVQVSADPGFNAGYWSEPGIRNSGQGYKIGDAPLRLFHFSGFDPGNPERASSHADFQEPSPALVHLQKRYAEALIGNGWSSQPVAAKVPGKSIGMQEHLLSRLGSYLLRRVLRKAIDNQTRTRTTS